VRLPDELVTRLELLARQRRKTMSVLLRDIIGKYTSRRYSPGRPRRRVHKEHTGILSSVSVVNAADSVVAAADGSRLSSEVEPLASELVASPSKEKYPRRTGDPYPGTPRSAPCPCGSGKKYKRCCGKGAPPLTESYEWIQERKGGKDSVGTDIKSL
jgi:hypothetical protein